MRKRQGFLMPTSSIVPLLVEPAMPSLEMQDATAQGAADLAETARWRYHLRYWHEHAAQDEVIVTAPFNIAPPSDDGTTTAPADAPPRFDLVLVAQLAYGEDGGHVEALRLTREQGEHGSAANWPCAGYRSPSGLVVDLGNGVGEGAVRMYAFDPPLLSEGWHRIGLAWGTLDVARAQNACVSLAVVRNRGLGADDIVYRRAAPVDALDVVTPFNCWPQDIDISDLGDTVDAALDAAFALLFDERRIGQRLTLGLAYGYALLPAVDPETALMTHVPVGEYPDARIAATTATQIAGQLAAWKDESKLPTTGAVWLFSLVQFSQIDARAPLLELGRLVYRLR
jgi:hypothetical protein